MIFKRLFRQDVGKPISASTINRIADVAEWVSNIKTGPPASVLYTATGPLIRSLGMMPRLAIADGNITARSGTSAGIGKVKIVSPAASFSSGGVMSGCLLTTSTIDIPVYNASSATMTSGHGIDSGMYCLVIQDLSGLYCVWPLECS